MLIFGASVSDWREKAAYAEDKADNEFAKVRDIRCEGMDDVQTAMAYIAACAKDTNCEKFIYHATINLKPGERLTPQQWMSAIDRLEKALKLTGHHRIAFEHIKNNRQHYHIYWSRIPPNGGAAVVMSNNYYAHQKVAKALELEFGLKAAPRKDKNQPSKKKQEINNKNNRIRMDKDIVTKEVTAIYKTSKTSADFIKNLAKAGFTLTRGKNSSYVIVDKQGGYHGLLRRIDGVQLGDLDKKFPNLAKTQLPTLSSVLKSRRPATKRHFRLASHAIGRPRKISASRMSSPARKSGKIFASRVASNGRSAIGRPAIVMPTKGKFVALLAKAKRRFIPYAKKHYPRPIMRQRRQKQEDENIPASEKMPFRRPEWESAENLAWAFENGRDDILVEFGIANGASDTPEP